MSDITSPILGDLLFVLMVALPAALGAFALLRRRFPPTLPSGLVISQPYNAVDMVVAAILILHFEMLSGALSFDSSAGTPTATPVPACLFFAAGSASTSSTISVLLFQIMYSFGVCTLLLVYLKRARGLDPVALFGWNRSTFSEALGRAVLIFVPVFIIMAVVGYYYQPWIEHILSQPAPLQEIAETFAATPSKAVRILIGLTAVITAPVMEEMVFRGFLYPVLKRHTDRWFALVFTSILFGAIHGNLLGLVPLALFAAGLTLAYEWTGCLRVPMLMHATFNSLSLLTLAR